MQVAAGRTFATSRVDFGSDEIPTPDHKYYSLLIMGAS